MLSSAAVTVNLEYVEVEVDREGEFVGKEMGKGGQQQGGEQGAGEAEGGQTVIRAGDEVAIVPPVSSG